MSEENSPPRSILFRIVRIFVILAVVGVGIYFFVLVPNMKEMQNKAKRSEVFINLKSIQTIQQMYFSENDTYVPAEAYPKKTSVEPQKWVIAESGGFEKMGFEPMGTVRGSYWVEATKNDFTAYGISDIDGDGVYATYTATKSQEPTLTTENNVY